MKYIFLFLFLIFGLFYLIPQNKSVNETKQLTPDYYLFPGKITTAGEITFENTDRKTSYLSVAPEEKPDTDIFIIFERTNNLFRAGERVLVKCSKCPKAFITSVIVIEKDYGIKYYNYIPLYSVIEITKYRSEKQER